jgi:DNA-binding transcriptional LysR family regulator
VAPTPAGAVAVEQARAVLQAVDALRREVSVHAEPARTRLQLGLASAAIDLTSAILRRYAADHPEITLHAQQFDFSDPTGGLASGQTEAAMIWGPLTTTGLRLRHLRTETMAVMVPADHPAAGQAQVRMADLAGETWCDTPTDDPV